MAPKSKVEDPAEGRSRREEGRGLVRSMAHRLLGDAMELPFEGRLASFDGASGWLNSDPLSADGLQGRVVLVDFWTYTCVNWLRTLPYLRAWDAKYRDAGLAIVGVHTPEFAFERHVGNVTRESENLEVKYAIAMDSDYAIWRAFGNHFWPALYLADGDGRIRYHHFGEGEYAATEMVIQQLLRDLGVRPVAEDLVLVEPAGIEVAADWRTLRSPETYLGYRQARGFAQESAGRLDLRAKYSPEERLRLNEWALSGLWTVGPHAAALEEAGGGIAFQFAARDVNLVMGPAHSGEPVRFRVYLDDQVAVEGHGTDVDAVGDGMVDAHRTYQLIRQAGPLAERRFEIEFLDRGVEAYCFTFG